MIDWQPIPDAPHEGAPFDGEEVLLYVDFATVDLVRLGWWWSGDDSECASDNRGFWSYRNSVTQEMLEGYYRPTHWAPYNPPPSYE